jgi:integrase
MAFFNWLEFNNYIEKGSLSRKITKPPNPIYEDDKALSESEISKIISSITLYSLSDPYVYKRDIVIISLLLYTGIRRGELLGLRIQDVDLINSKLFISPKTSKSKKGRFIPLHFLLQTHLKIYLLERKKRTLKTDALIISSTSNEPLTKHGLKYWVKKYVSLSGINFHIHRFRHTFACTLAKNNADIVSIMNVLGHSTTRMTERYLRSIKTENARSFIEKLSY